MTGSTHHRATPIVLALAALLVLTGTSWALSHLLGGGAAIAAGLGIAAVKATVVALGFMELGRAEVPARVTALVTVAFIALLCAGVIADVELR